MFTSRTRRAASRHRSHHPPNWIANSPWRRLLRAVVNRRLRVRRRLRLSPRSQRRRPSTRSTLVRISWLLFPPDNRSIRDSHSCDGGQQLDFVQRIDRPVAQRQRPAHWLVFRSNHRHRRWRSPRYFTTQIWSKIAIVSICSSFIKQLFFAM